MSGEPKLTKRASARARWVRMTTVQRAATLMVGVPVVFFVLIPLAIGVVALPILIVADLIQGPSPEAKRTTQARNPAPPPVQTVPVPAPTRTITNTVPVPAPTRTITNTVTAPPRLVAGRSNVCVSSHGYGGLGASRSDWETGNANATDAANVPDGVAVYSIDHLNAHGCVVAFSVRERTQPPIGTDDIIALTSGTDLPDDAEDIKDSSGCRSFKSTTLQRTIGYSYATATGTGQRAGAPGMARIQATRQPGC